MYRISSIYIFVLYIIPFTLLLNSKFLFEFYQVMIIFSAFYVGGFMLKIDKHAKPIDYKNFYVSNETVLLIVALLYFIVNYKTTIDTFLHLLVYQDYASWALENAIKRYAGEFEGGFLKKLSTIFFITYMIMLGAYGFGKKWKLFYFLLLLILIIESSALARAGVLIGFVAYFSEFLIRHNYYFSTIKNKKLLKIGATLLLIAFIIFFFSAYFRIQNEDNISDILMVKLGEYILATYEALFVWMQNAKEYANTYGLSTFAGIYKIFTNVHVQSGFYNLVETEYGPTVIFTTIRGFLADFGFSATVLIFLSTGTLVKYFTYKRMNLISYFFIRLIIFLILYMLYSPFLFATILIAYVLAYILLVVSNVKFRNIEVKKL